MSFELLEKEIIDVGLCQGCALCVGLCKHIVMEENRPSLKDYCILEKEGQDCGNATRVVHRLIKKHSKLKSR